MERINFINGQAPAISAKNLNLLQDYIETAIQTALEENSLKQHPIGSIYTSLDSTNPSELFGGTWESIKGQFLLAENAEYKEEYTAGQTGGAENVTLTANQSGVQAHSHSYCPRIQWFNNKSDYQVIRSAASYTPDVVSTGSGYTGWMRVDDYENALENGGLQWVNQDCEKDATESHTNMPPFLAVYMWKRIA